jgi:hypothetical protein
MEDLEALRDLEGKTISKITGFDQYSGEVIIYTTDGYAYAFHHIQDCCEDVSLEDYLIEGDMTGATVIVAEEVDGEIPAGDYESVTYTFYRIVTDEGLIWMRWCGSSNGYYSESVDIKRIPVYN